MLKLTSAQVSALECAGLECDVDGEHALVRAAWSGRFFKVDLERRDETAAQLHDMANSDDENARVADRSNDGRAACAARGARDALTNLARRGHSARERTY